VIIWWILLSTIDSRPLGEIFSSRPSSKFSTLPEYDILCLPAIMALIQSYFLNTMQAARILGKEKAGWVDQLAAEFWPAPG